MNLKTRIFLALVCAAALFIITQFITGAGGYIGWFFGSKYTIESVNITQNINDDGSLYVHEVINVRMRKDFRGLYRYIPTSRYVQLSDVNIWVEEIEDPDIQFTRKTETSFEAQIWFKRSHAEIQAEGQEYTLHVTYLAKDVLETSEDSSQIFRQYWSDGWDAPVRNLSVVYTFPENLIPDKIYTHPKVKVKAEDNTFSIENISLPPYAYAETRFFYQEPQNLEASAYNEGLSQREVEEIETYYNTEWLKKKLIPPIVYVVFLIVIWLLFKYLGKEPEIAYKGVYEREVPSRDSPDVINAIVKNLTKSVDRDGFASVILNLYRKDYIAFTSTEHRIPSFKDERSRIYFLSKDPYQENDLSKSEKYLYGFLKGYANENILNFKVLEDKVSRDNQEALLFKRGFGEYQKLVVREAKSRKFFNSNGYILSVFLGIVMILTGFILNAYITDFPTPNMVIEAIVYFALYIFTATVLFFLPKEIFGKWSKEGLTFYHKWKNFENFVDDISMIRDYPPESVEIWEDYLVYATALGCADTVMESLKNVIPEEKWGDMSDHSSFYNRYDTRYTYLMNSVLRSANFRITQTNIRIVLEILRIVLKASSAMSKGERGSSGGIGRGSSSGGGGAL